MIKKFSLVLLLSCIIAQHNNTYALTNSHEQTASGIHLPQKYTATINLLCDIADPDDIADSLRTLYTILEKNEPIDSSSMIQKATKNALLLLKKSQNKFVDKSHFVIIYNYLDAALSFYLQPYHGCSSAG